MLRDLVILFSKYLSTTSLTTLILKILTFRTISKVESILLFIIVTNSVVSIVYFRYATLVFTSNNITKFFKNYN